MMLLIWLRIGLTILRSLWRSRISLHDESILSRRVGLFEAEGRYPNQAVYACYFELGRWDIAVRTGMLKVMVRERLFGVLGGQVIRYCKPLQRFQRFEVRSRILGWDERFIYFDHRITSGGNLAAQSLSRIALLGPAGIGSARELLARISLLESPPLPDMIKQWRDIEVAMK